MKQIHKFLLLALIALLISLGVTTHGQAAYFSQVKGSLYETRAAENPWTKGATITVFDCSSGTKTFLNSSSIPNDGVSFTFTVNITPISSGARTLCVEVDYNTVPKGDPETDLNVFFDDNVSATTTLETGNWAANVTPTAVTLTDFQARSGVSSPWAILLPAVAVLFLAGMALTFIRRRAGG